jgi:Tol biopolymer transport system component
MSFSRLIWAVSLVGVGVFTPISSAQVPKRLDPTATRIVQADFEFTADGSAIVYRAKDATGSNADGLFCVPSTGGSSWKLTGDLGAAGSLFDWQLSSNSTPVFWATEPGHQQREVFRATLLGDAPLKLNTPLVDVGSTEGVVVGNRVVYIASERTSPFAGTYFELFSVPTSGGSVTRISGEPIAGGDVEKVVAREGIDWVVYLADHGIDEVMEVYAASTTGGAPIKLNSSLVSNGDVFREGLQISPTGDRVLYAADQEQDSATEIFSVSIFGGAVTKLNGPLTSGGDVTPGSPQFSPNGSRVLYHADQNSDEMFELFCVPSNGGTPVRLNGSLVAGGDVRESGIQFSPTSDRVLYSADQQTDQVFELYSVSSQGGVAVRLNGPLAAGGDVADDATFSPDGSRVIYRADQRIDEVSELFITSSVGGTPLRLSSELDLGGDVVTAAFSPDGSQVVYLADQNADEVYELFAVASSGGDARKISGPLTNGGDVIDWRFSPDGQTLVYRADQELDELFELFSVSLSTALDGDYNLDGVVDAADYTVWRDTLANSSGGAEKFTLWRANFGRKSGSGQVAVAPSSVPEPATWMLLGGAMLVVIRRGRRRELLPR